MLSVRFASVDFCWVDVLSVGLNHNVKVKLTHACSELIQHVDTLK